MAKPRLSVVIISYNMAREIPRTLQSLSPGIQRGINKDDYEIILVDNGSSRPLETPNFGANLRVLHMPNPGPSPAEAVNRGLTMAKGEIIGVLVDGARMSSPGLLAGVLTASRLHSRPVIATMAFHLGPDHQSRSQAKGYNQQVEDKLLQKIRWEQDAYDLFNASVFAGSSKEGWFMPMAESVALFLTRSMWEELGGFDENFVCRGGGLVSLDTYARSCNLPDSQLIMLLGEGTFHQFHGGVASNAKASPWHEFHDEYVRIRGHGFVRPQQKPLYVGHVPVQVLPFMEESAFRAQRRVSYKDYAVRVARRIILQIKRIGSLSFKTKLDRWEH